MYKAFIKIFTLLFVLLIAISNILPAQQGNGKGKGNDKREMTTDIPQVVMSAFQKDYATATNVSWFKPRKEGKRGTVYIVKCMMNQQKTHVRYSADATILNRSVKLKPNEFPENIQKAVKTQAPNAQIKGGMRIERMGKNDIVYRIVTIQDNKKSHLTLDANGNSIKDKNKIKEIEVEEKEVGEE